MSEIVVDSLVKHLTDGPIMAVSRIDLKKFAGGEAEVITCRWFKDDKFQEATFRRGELKPYDPEDDAPLPMGIG